MRTSELIAAIPQWAQRRADLRGLALVGSYATGNPTPTSDVDLVILTDAPETYAGDQQWVCELGVPRGTAIERWGKLTTVRVFFQDGPEVEFGFAKTEWCAVPVDPGTRRVVSGGIHVLHDPEHLFANLLQACSDSP